VNGKFYIGSSKNVRYRWHDHLTELRQNCHSNPRLQNSWNTYGESSFKFEVLEEASEEELLNLEQWWIDKTDCCNREIGFNLCPISSSPMKGRKASPETLAKLSRVRTGMKKKFVNKDEWKANIKKSWEVRRKTPVSQVTRDKQRLAHTGLKNSEDANTKISQALKGRMPQAALENMRKHNASRVTEYVVCSICERSIESTHLNWHKRRSHSTAQLV
jgi:group I intron endonuclease